MDHTRDIIVSCRLSEDEFKYLEEIAARDDRTPGQMLRWLFLQEKRQTKQPRRKPEPVAEYAQ